MKTAIDFNSEDYKICVGDLVLDPSTQEGVYESCFQFAGQVKSVDVNRLRVREQEFTVPCDGLFTMTIHGSKYQLKCKKGDVIFPFQKRAIVDGYWKELELIIEKKGKANGNRSNRK